MIVFKTGVFYSTEFCYIRWGGGAEPGKTHVFAASGEFLISMQCVTDDFGNLVKVPA